MSQRLSNKVALITGGTTGIGRATALAFAREGAKVVIAGRRAAEGEATVQLVREEGGEAVFVQADVSRDAEVQFVVARTLEAYGRLDVAFNNAGVEGDLGPIHAQSEENYDRIMDINVKGVWLSLKHEIPAMLANGGGSIINTASIAGLIGFPYASVYAASKHAVLGLTKTAALELAKSGVRVNAISPGAVQTDMVDRFTGGDATMRSHMETLHPVGRFGRDTEVAEAVVWLASDGSSYVTGQSLTVDGGFTAQ